MTTLLKSVISVDSNGNERVFDSISSAADYMLSLEEYRHCNKPSMRSNISSACNPTQSRKSCCGLGWKYAPTTPFIFVKEDWKQFRESQYYFSDKYEFCYNPLKKSQVYGDKNGRIRLYCSQTEGYSIFFIDALWISYNGEIPGNKHVTYKNPDNSSNLLENLECCEFICTTCNTQFESEDNRSKFCSPRCKNIHGGIMNRQAKRQKLRPYISEKIKSWKKEFNLSADEIIEKVPGIQDLICQYCGTENLQFASGDNCEPNKLSIDAKHPGDHSIDNLIGCCWLCNRMKNDSSYDEWMRLLRFLKGDDTILDLSKCEYVKKDVPVSVEYSYRPWSTLNTENPEMFKERGSAKKHLIQMFNEQNKKDSIFGLFPLVMLTRSNLLNMSCDKIDPTNNTKWQLVPLFLNYAKSVYSTERLVSEFKKRNFLQNTDELVVQLPEDYEVMSAFYEKLNGRRTGKGNKGMKYSEERKKSISESKLGKNMGVDNVRSKPIVSVDVYGNRVEYASGCEAARILGLQSRASTNMSSCAHGKLNQPTATNGSSNKHKNMSHCSRKQNE
jgi:hypothetical protein